jgi:hypothetical protein
MTQEEDSQNLKGQMQMWTRFEPWYAQIVWESVRRKRPDLWPDKRILHHDYAPVHDALSVCEFLAKKPITEMARPPYSPDSAPCDFWLFPKLRNALKEHRVADSPDFQLNMTTLLPGSLEMIFRTVSVSGTVVSQSARLHKESISIQLAAASALKN